MKAVHHYYHWYYPAACLESVLICVCVGAIHADYQDVCRQLGEKDHLLIEQQRQSERDVEAARAEINRLISSQDNERGQLELELVKARWVEPGWCE